MGGDDEAALLLIEYDHLQPSGWAYALAVEPLFIGLSPREPFPGLRNRLEYVVQQFRYLGMVGDHVAPTLRGQLHSVAIRILDRSENGHGRCRASAGEASSRNASATSLASSSRGA